ncbi:MAG: exosortase, partial [Hyphococcus sp.]
MTDATNLDIQPAASPTKMQPVLLLALVAAAFGFAFFNGIENLFKRWGEQQELSHGYFLPLIAGWMIWARRDALVKSLSQPMTLGLAGAGLSVIILILSELTVTSLMIFQHMAMILLFASTALALGGRNIFWLTLLPVAFLLFMVPPPYWVITVLSQKFQFWSSQLGVFMIELFGVPVFLSGNIIDLGDYQLQVAEACSGLRYLFPFLSLGFLAAYLYQAPLWQRAVVFLSTIPITILMNSFRIALTGVLVQKYGASHAEGLVHFFEGWVVFLLCMIMLFAVIAVLARFSGQKDLGGLLSLPDVGARPVRRSWRSDLFARNAILISAALFAAGAYVHFGVSNVLRVPDRADLDRLPYEFTDWESDTQEVDKQTLEVLGADDYLITNMTSPSRDAF